MAEERTTIAKRHLITNAAGLIEHIYFENVLTSKFKSKDILLWRRGFVLISTGNERLWIYFGLRKIRFDQGRPTEESTIGVDGSDNPTFQRTSVGIFSEFHIQNTFKNTD